MYYPRASRTCPILASRLPSRSSCRNLSEFSNDPVIYIGLPRFPRSCSLRREAQKPPPVGWQAQLSKISYVLQHRRIADLTGRTRSKLAAPQDILPSCVCEESVRSASYSARSDKCSVSPAWFTSLPHSLSRPLSRCGRHVTPLYSRKCAMYINHGILRLFCQLHLLVEALCCRTQERLYAPKRYNIPTS